MTGPDLEDLDRRTCEVLALLVERRGLRGPITDAAFADRQAIEGPWTAPTTPADVDAAAAARPSDGPLRRPVLGIQSITICKRQLQLPPISVDVNRGAHGTDVVR